MLLLWSSVATAMTAATPLASLAQAGAQLPLDIQTGVAPGVTVQQVAASPDDAFLAFDTRKTYDSDQQGLMWLRFRLQVDKPTAADGWTLELPKPFVDRVEFHWQDAEGRWQMQAAGDHVAHRLWPMRSLNPQFRLPALAPGVHSFYLRVQSSIPLHFSIDLRPADQAEASDLSDLLTTAFVLSLLIFVGVLSGLLALVYKHWVYAWYAVFAAANFFAIAGYMGVSTYLFWPDALWWPEYSALVPTMLSAMAQLQFSRAMLLTTPRHSAWQRVIDGSLVLNAIVVVAVLLTPDAITRLVEYGWVVASSVLLMLMMVLVVWRQDPRLSGLWLVAYLPLAIGLGAAIVEHFGVFPINQFPYLVPVYAVAYELPVLLLVMLWHAKTRLADRVRDATLASTDPATGFVQTSAFADTAQTLWNEARQQKKDLGIAYVQVARDEERAALVKTYDADRERARWVRIMRTVMREGDTVAQIDSQVFALFFKGQPAGEDFSKRLSRLVALGLMAPQDYAAQKPLQLRVVAATRDTVSDSLDTWAALDRALRERLATHKGWSRRSIRFVDVAPVAPTLPDEVHSDDWAQALEAQVAKDRKPA